MDRGAGEFAMKEPALALFDVDGTIFDSQNLIVEGFRRAFHEAGYEAPAREAILHSVGLSLDRAIADMRPDFDGVAIENLASHYVRQVAGKHGDALPFFAGMEGLIHRLGGVEHLWMGVATGKNRRGLDPLLESHGLYNVFPIKQTPDLHPSKPAPDMILDVLDRYGVEAERAVMIGDTVFDVEMGRNAGVRSIGVSWGYHEVEALEAIADVVVWSADEIEDVMCEWGLL